MKTNAELINDFARKNLDAATLWDKLGEHFPDPVFRRQIMAEIQKLTSDSMDQAAKRKRMAEVAATEEHEKRLREAAVARKALLDSVTTDFSPPKRVIKLD